MPAGFHVASAYVDIHAEDGGLRNEIERAIKSAASGQDGKVKLSVEASDLRARIEGAVKAASEGMKGKVNLDLDAKGLRGKIESEVKSAAAGAKGQVKLDLQAADLRSKIEAAIKAASAGNAAKVDLDVDSGTLRGKVEAAIASASGTNVKVGTDFDPDGLASKVRAAVDAASAQKVRIRTDADTAGMSTQVRLAVAAASANRVHIKVDADLDMDQMGTRVRNALFKYFDKQRVAIGVDLKDGEFKAKMASMLTFANASKVNVKLDIDTAAFSAKVQAVSAMASGKDIKFKADFDSAGLRAKADATAASIRPTIHVNTDIDRDTWQRAMAAMANDVSSATNRMGGSFTSLRGIASGSGSMIFAAFAVLAPIIAVLIADVMLLGAALAAIVLPAGIIAIGAALTQSHAQLQSFVSDLKNIGSQITGSMGPAITAGMNQVISSLQNMKSQMTAMFSSGAQLVQPFVQSIMGMVQSMLPGITAALNNLKSAMPGIEQGFSSMGAGIGNFFAQLSANGSAIGQVWATIGTGINQVMTSLGSAMSQMASSPALVSTLAQSFGLLAQSIDVISTTITSFGPALNSMLTAASSGMQLLGPALDGVGRGLSALNTLATGGGPIAAFHDLFSKPKSDADKLKDSMAGVAAAANTTFGQIGTASGTAAASVAKQAAAAQKLADTYRTIGNSMGSGGVALAQQLDQAKVAADALANSFSKVSSNAQNSLSGQINLAQAISQAKSQASSLHGALSMTNGQLNLTSTKAQQAAQSLNQIAQAGTQAATAMANQGNWAGAAQAIDQARSAITSLGQQMGLSKSQATQLANQLTTFPDKEVTFKLNVESARQGLNDVSNQMSQLTGKQSTITVKALTEPAKAALTALGFQVKDLGNGEFQVKANTSTAKAALESLKTVLSAMNSGAHDVNVTAKNVPAVSAALKALGASVTSLPNGDVKVTAHDGATTIIHGVKSNMDSIPKSKNVNLTATDHITPPATTAKTAVQNLHDKIIQMGGKDGITPLASRAKAATDGIPSTKNTDLQASGNAAEKANEVSLKVNGLPASKNIMVVVALSGLDQIDKLKVLNTVNNKTIAVSVRISGTEQIDKLKTLNQVNNKTISVNVHITGTEQIDKLKELNKVQAKNISVSIRISGADQIDKLKGLNQVNSKAIQVSVHVSGADQVDKLKGLNQVNSKAISVNVHISGADQIDKLKQINSIQNKSITVSVSANTGPVTTLKSAVDGLKNKSVSISVSAPTGTVNSLKSAIAAIKSKSVTITASAPRGQVDGLHSAINAVKSKSVTVTANVNGTGAVQALVSAIAAVHSKTVTVTVNTVKTGSAATGGYMSSASLPGFSTGGGSYMRSYKSAGPVVGPGTGLSDSILARISNGEFIIRASMVKKYGPELLTAINNGAYNPIGMMKKWGWNLPGFASGGIAPGDVQPGDRGADVLAIQKALKEIYPSFDYSSGPGVFGPRTRAAYSQFQQSLGFRGQDANGAPGIQSLVALANRTNEFQVKAATATVKYIVQWGDTLTSIAKKFGTSVDELVAINHISNPNQINAHSALQIPINTHHGQPPVIPTGVIPGSHPGDWNYLAPPNFGTLKRKQEKTGTGSATKDVEDVWTLLGIAGQNMNKQTKMFENITGTNQDDMVKKITSAQDIGALAQTLDQIRSGVFNALEDSSGRTALQNYLQQGSNIEVKYQQQLDMVNKALTDAQKTVDDLTNSFKQLQSSVEQTVGQFATITKTGKAGASVDTMIRQLTADTGLTQQFDQALIAMKGRGLNGTALAQVAALGPQDGMRTLNSLLQATPQQIAQLNALQSQVNAAAADAGTAAADAMYGAGLNAAKGMVDGLTSQKEAITNAMTTIANAMKDAILQALGIKSPSRVMHGYGVNTIQGLIQGMESEGKDIGDVVRALVAQITGAGQNINLNGAVAASGTGAATGAGAATGNGLSIGQITVNVDASGTNVNSPDDAQKLAKQLAKYMIEEIRKENMKRK